MRVISLRYDLATDGLAVEAFEHVSQGSGYHLELRFHRSGTPELLTPGSVLVATAKASRDGEAVIVVNEWAEPARLLDPYTAAMYITGETLDGLLIEGEASVDLEFQIRHRPEAVAEPSLSEILVMTVEKAVATDEDGLPNQPANEYGLTDARYARRSQNLSDLANVATAFGSIKQAATTTASGVVELATEEETITGEDATRAVTPAGLAAVLEDFEGGGGGSGSVWYTGAGVPDNGVGNDGDMYLRTNGDYYQKAAGDWGAPVGSLKGIPGTNGEDGTGINGDDGEDGDHGWSPVMAIEADGERRVLRVISWTGGTGTPPTATGYVTGSGFSGDAADGIDVRGPAGEDGEDGGGGSGSGDVVGPAGATAGNLAVYADTTGKLISDSGYEVAAFLAAAANLSDLASPATAFGNIKQAASTTESGVVELATTGEATTGTDTARAVTPAGLKAAIDALVASAPGALDTLNEISEALGDDPDFAATMVAALAGKASTSHASTHLTGGSDAIQAATASQPGLMTAAYAAKVDGVEAAADVTDAANVGSAIHGATGKTTPVDADEIPLIDSAASNVLKKLTWANLKATIKSYFDTLYVAVGAVLGTKTIAKFGARDNEPPTANFATFDTRNSRPVLDFDASTQETAIFSETIPEGVSLANGLTVLVRWAATTATSGTIGWDAAFERVADGGLDTDGDSFGTAQTITAATVPGTSGITKVTSVTFSQAQLPSGLVAGDDYRLRIRRDMADSASGDAELSRVEVRLA